MQRQCRPMATRWRRSLSHAGRVLQAVISSPAKLSTLLCGSMGQHGVQGVAGSDVLSSYRKAWHQQETQDRLLLLLTLNLGGSSKLSFPREVVREERRPTLLLLDLSLPVTHTVSLLGHRIMKCMGLKAGREAGSGSSASKDSGRLVSGLHDLGLVTPGAGPVLFPHLRGRLEDL